MASSVEYVVLTGFKIILSLIILTALSTAVVKQVDKIGSSMSSGLTDFDAKFISVEEEQTK